MIRHQQSLTKYNYIYVWIYISMYVCVCVYGMFCQAIDTFVALKLLSSEAQNGGKYQQQQQQRQLHFAEKAKAPNAPTKVS